MPKLVVSIKRGNVCKFIRTKKGKISKLLLAKIGFLGKRRALLSCVARVLFNLSNSAFVSFSRFFQPVRSFVANLYLS